MEIRRLIEADAQPWWNLRLEALETEPLAFGMSGEEHRATPVEKIAARFAETPERMFTLGAFHEGVLIGMASFFRHTGLKERHKASIYGVYVAPRFRGKGAGRALLTALLAAARQHDSLEQILISVTTVQQPARDLYLSLGFEVFGSEPRALKVGSEYVAEDHMMLRFR